MRLIAAFLLCEILALASVPFQVTTSVSRTAVFVGDHFDYTIRVEYDPQLEFVRDHLKKDDLNLQPFEVIDAAIASGSLSNGRKFLELRLELATYATAAANVAIPPITLFYFTRARTAGKEDSPAETVNLPAFSMAIRNTVVDASGGIRDSKPPLPISRQSWMIPLVLGWCGLAAVAFVIARFALAGVRSGIWKQKQAERNRKKSLRDSVEEIRSTPAKTDDELAGFYDKASTVLRGLAAETLGDGAGLTPAEMKQSLIAAGDPEHHAAALSDLLAECDLVRYAPNGLERGRQRHADFLSKFEQLTSTLG